MLKSRFLTLALGLSMCAMSAVSMAEDIGSVDTSFKVLGANNKIVVQAFDDPEVTGVACYLSSAKLVVSVAVSALLLTPLMLLLHVVK